MRPVRGRTMGRRCGNRAEPPIPAIQVKGSRTGQRLVQRRTVIVRPSTDGPRNLAQHVCAGVCRGLDWKKPNFRFHRTLKRKK